ncbi:MAG: PDZ domain-containing protein [Bacteroidota bacterium]
MKLTTVVLLVFLLSLTGISCSSAQSHEEKNGRTLAPVSEDPGRGWLGVSIQDMTARRAKELKSKTEEGARVMEVVEDSPAEKAGLREDDIVVEVDGHRIEDASDLREQIRSKKPGQSVTLTVIRNDGRQQVKAVLDEEPERAERFPPMPEIPPPVLYFSESGTNGLRLMELNDQLGAFFGAPDNRGVLVEEVRSGSTADKAGFKAGDVITRIGKDRIEDLRDVRTAMRDYDNGDSAQVEVIRKSAQVTLTLNVKQLGLNRFEFRSRGFGPSLQDRHFDWNSRDFEDRMQEFGRKMDRFGKDLEHRLKGLGEKIKIELRHIEI